MTRDPLRDAEIEALRRELAQTRWALLFVMVIALGALAAHLPGPW